METFYLAILTLSGATQLREPRSNASVSLSLTRKMPEFVLRKEETAAAPRVPMYSLVEKRVLSCQVPMPNSRR